MPLRNGSGSARAATAREQLWPRPGGGCRDHQLEHLPRGPARRGRLHRLRGRGGEGDASRQLLGPAGAGDPRAGGRAGHRARPRAARTPATRGPRTPLSPAAAPHSSASATPTWSRLRGCWRRSRSRRPRSRPRGWSGRCSPAAATATTRGSPRRAVLTARLFAGRVGTRVPPLPRGSEALEVEQPSGACFLMRREAWEAAGGFDEEFFLWYEDVDLARRLLASGPAQPGRRCRRGSSSGRLLVRPPAPERAQDIRLSSMQHYIDKHHPRLRGPSRPLVALARRLRVR